MKWGFQYLVKTGAYKLSGDLQLAQALPSPSPGPATGPGAGGDLTAHKRGFPQTPLLGARLLPCQDILQALSPRTAGRDAQEGAFTQTALGNLR